MLCLTSLLGSLTLSCVLLVDLWVSCSWLTCVLCKTSLDFTLGLCLEVDLNQVWLWSS